MKSSHLFSNWSKQEIYGIRGTELNVEERIDLLEELGRFRLLAKDVKFPQFTLKELLSLKPRSRNRSLANLLLRGRRKKVCFDSFDDETKSFLEKKIFPYLMTKKLCREELIAYLSEYPLKEQK